MIKMADNGTTPTVTPDGPHCAADDSGASVSVCTCAASYYAGEWLSLVALGSHPLSITAINRLRAAAFLAGYHMAVNLTRIALHSEPDENGRIPLAP